MVSESRSEDTFPDTTESFDPEGLIIDTIIVVNSNIRSNGGNGLERFISKAANRLHVVTRQKVVRDEIILKKGEPYTKLLADETSRNLRRRLAINDAWVNAEPNGKGQVKVIVTTIDRWSLLFNLKVRRDGNETDIQFGAHERNLFGRNHLLAFDYFLKEKEVNYLDAEYQNSRIKSAPISAGFLYSDNPLGTLRQISISHPFYSLSQQFSISANFSDIGGRHDEYRDTEVVGRWRNSADIFTLETDYRWGSYTRKVRLEGLYRYTNRKATDRTIFDTTVAIQFPEDSTYHEFSAVIEFRDLNFVVERGISGFYYNEDITLSKSISFGIGRAFTPSFNDYEYDRLIFGTVWSDKIGSHIISLSYNYNRWFRGGEVLRDRSIAGLTVYNRKFSFVTGVLRAVYVADDLTSGQQSLTLGGRSGLRGFETHYSTGNRELLFNIEGRFFSGLEFMSVLLGTVLFIDAGQAWDSGESVKFSNFDYSIGTGLRLSMERFTRTQLVRIDLSYAQNNEWQISIGSGQYF